MEKLHVKKDDTVIVVSGDDKGEARVVPAAVVSQSLLVNRNLTTVYRDQIAGKFDVPATDKEIDSAIARLMKLDAQKKDAEVAASPAPKADELVASNAPSESVALSEPVSSLDENGKPVVDLRDGAPIPTQEDADRADVGRRLGLRSFRQKREGKGQGTG